MVILWQGVSSIESMSSSYEQSCVKDWCLFSTWNAITEAMHNALVYAVVSSQSMGTRCQDYYCCRTFAGQNKYAFSNSVDALLLCELCVHKNKIYTWQPIRMSSINIMIDCENFTQAIYDNMWITQQHKRGEWKGSMSICWVDRVSYCT